MRMAIRNRRNRELEAHAMKLEQSNKRLKAFSHMLVHEIKSPLATVSGFFQFLEEKYRGKIDDETRGLLKDMQAVVRGMSDLVDRLHEFAHFESRTQEFTDVDMEAVFYQASAHLRAEIKAARTTITHDPLPTIRGDELQIRQLLQNLIGNAIKYRGPCPPHIHVAAEGDECAWTFGVMDNGLGVPAEHQERIFEMFVRLHNLEEIAGNGVGLAFCKLIVENHGGRIWLESTPGKGSAFRFTLPKQPVAPNYIKQSCDGAIHKIPDA